MYFTSALLCGIFSAFVAAQSDVLTFTRVPNPITDGEVAVILYATNDTSSPVTLTLRQGDTDDLDTVYVITENAEDGQYLWTPPIWIPNGDDYALQIEQGSQVNYFGPLIIQGANPSAVSSKSVAESISESRAVSQSIAMSLSSSIAAFNATRTDLTSTETTNTETTNTQTTETTNTETTNTETTNTETTNTETTNTQTTNTETTNTKTTNTETTNTKTTDTTNTKTTNTKTTETTIVVGGGAKTGGGGNAGSSTNSPDAAPTAFTPASGSAALVFGAIAGLLYL